MPPPLPKNLPTKREIWQDFRTANLDWSWEQTSSAGPNVPMSHAFTTIQRSHVLKSLKITGPQKVWQLIYFSVKKRALLRTHTQQLPLPISYSVKDSRDGLLHFYGDLQKREKTTPEHKVMLFWIPILFPFCFVCESQLTPSFTGPKTARFSNPRPRRIEVFGFQSPKWAFLGSGGIRRNNRREKSRKNWLKSVNRRRETFQQRWNRRSPNRAATWGLWGWGVEAADCSRSMSFLLRFCSTEMKSLRFRVEPPAQNGALSFTFLERKEGSNL